MMNTYFVYSIQKGSNLTKMLSRQGLTLLIVYHLNTQYSTDEGKLAYTEVSHLIEATFRCGPPSLMHLCMTKVLLHGVSLDQSPQVVREMSQGLYNKNNPPANITEEGKEVLKRLAAAYDKHFDDEEEEEEEGVEEEETDGEDAVEQSSDEDSGL